MYTGVRKFGLSIVMLVVMFLASEARAQLEVGDNFSMTANGTLGYGYAGSFSNFGDSSHSQGFGANGDINGSYFHPDFLNFQVRPYFNRAQSNSDSQVITRGTGFYSSVGLLGGSHFPGTISYGMDFSNNSEFYVAGVPSVVGDSSGRSFGVTWSELLPNYPKVYLSYLTNSSNATLLSTDEKTHTAGKLFNVNSQYRVAGWDLSAYFNHNNNDFTSPDFVTGQSLSFSGSSNNYGANAVHAIPLGSIGLGISHSSYDGDQGADGSSTIYTEAAGWTLFKKLAISQSFNYTTNTTAALYQTTVTGLTPLLLPERSANGLFFRTSATYPVFRGLTVTGYYSHRQSTFNDQEYSDNQYGGTLGFNHQNRLGMFIFSVGLVDTANKQGNGGLGLVGSVGLNKKLGHWDTSANFTYFQNVQTLYSIGTSSSYSYGGNVRRKLNPHTFWAASYTGTHTGMTLVPGNSNLANTGATSFSWKRYVLAGNYTASQGVAIWNSAGQLVSTPSAPLLSDYNFVFNAKSWSASGHTTIRRLTFGGGYSKVSSDARTGLNGVLTTGDRYFVDAIYQLRLFQVQGGYSRVNQDVSTIPGGARNVNSFFISLSRWFNVF